MDRSFTQHDRFLRLIGGLMNFRKLLTYLTVSTAAVIPFAGAQNPTILQGSYISNVFGNSNFVLNPNAQTNIANVTTVTATVTRSTTTPLVATSEFNVAIGTANGTATWATRAFDAGMKGQNCEARFTYRGFAATSKVHIKQNSNTVASLTLTPATDPRIASINFPCGDLSNPTTFQVTDTAILAGTNEIGGIYVGLATNMANVAQAENVVQASRTGSQSFTTAETAIIFNIETKDAYGEFDTGTGRFTAKRAGDYLVSSTWLSDLVSWTSGNFLQLALHKNTSFFCRNYSPIEQTQTMNRGITTTCVISLAVGDYIESRITQNQATMNSEPSAAYVFTSISRFPSSSELVVTPERQNTFGGVVYTSGNHSLFAGSAAGSSFSSYNSATWNQPTMLKGKAAVTTTNSGNDLGFSIPNMPVGSYQITLSGALNAIAPTAGQQVFCNYRIRETTTSVNGVDVVKWSHTTNNISGYATRDLFASGTGVFNNTAVATRNFILEANKFADISGSNGGFCEAYTNTSAGGTYNTQIAIIMTPLDQPSNSALYVQGPVLSGQTGAVLPAGYIGEIITSASATSGSFLTGVTTKNVATITLQPGTWLLSANLRFEPITTFTNNILSISSSTSHDEQNAIQPQAALSGAYNSVANLTRVVRITSLNTIYYLNTSTWLPSGTGNYSQLVFTATRIGSN